MSKLRAALAAKGASYKPRTHHLEENGAPKYLNRLVFETSPYLLQHAHNPVNWFAWGAEAFERAKRENKPILLSVGYSTCHWCHVMERESFEDTEIAAFINQNFIAIKVDREERPDVDDVYMRAVRFLSGRGGWPMTVLMTPEKEPFFGGTYIPARDGDRGTRQGFLTLLRQTSAQFKKDPTELIAKGQAISQKVEAASVPQSPGDIPGAAVLAQTAGAYIQRLDRRHGGFGRAPKFPRPASLDFLMRYAAGSQVERERASEALGAATLTLSKMSSGGMNDQVGGGFHRYSTDERWLVPHFEKMLYDNAQLVGAYLDAFQITGDVAHRETARVTLDYVLREMTGSEGGFYSATDADSLVPGGHMEEGYFFTWTPEELAATLPSEEVRAVTAFYGVTSRGNFEGRSIFFRSQSLTEVAKAENLVPSALQGLLASARSKLYEERKKRVSPGLDDKILTSWNGLMIGAMARGSFVLDQPRYLDAARRAADYLLKTARGKDGALLRSTKDGVSKQRAFADDYSFFIHGLLLLSEASGEPRYLREAIRLQEILDAQFWDERDGAYFTTGHEYETLLARDKPSYDGAEPSANSVAAENLLVLAGCTDNDSFRERAAQILAAFSGELARGMGAPRLLSALSSYLSVPLQVILVQGEDSKEAGAMASTLRKSYLPDAFVVLGDPAQIESLAAVAPSVAGKGALSGKTTAYVCERGRCELPAKDAATLRSQLAKYRSTVSVAPSL